MDLFWVKLYIEQRVSQYRKWLKVKQHDYTNRDMVIDYLQVFAIGLTLYLEFSR
jgi:hypothetical protein